MFIKSEYVLTSFIRQSKLKQEHSYVRKKEVITFKCDSCSELFVRERGKMDPKRLSNNYYHVCSNCDAKKFAQEKGVEIRKVWDMPVSSLKTLDQF